MYSSELRESADARHSPSRSTGRAPDRLAAMPTSVLHRAKGNLPGQHPDSCHGNALHASHAVAKYRSSDVQLKAGQDLFAAGDPCKAVYILAEGWAILYALLEDGRRQILHFALPGSMLSRHPFVSADATYSVQALSDCTVHVIPHETLQPLFVQYPEFAVQMAYWICHDRCAAFAHLTSVGRGSSRERVAHLLAELFVRCRSQWPGYRISGMRLPLTQEHIGDATGLSSVHVNRVLRELAKERIVEFHYHRLNVLDPDRLLEVARADSGTVRLWAG